jgi:hypothetical protein
VTVRDAKLGDAVRRASSATKAIAGSAGLDVVAVLDGDEVAVVGEHVVGVIGRERDAVGVTFPDDQGEQLAGEVVTSGSQAAEDDDAVGTPASGCL